LEHTRIYSCCLATAIYIDIRPWLVT